MITKTCLDYCLMFLPVDEGYESEPYYCSNMFPTRGYGEKLGPQYGPLDVYEATTKGDAEKFLRSRCIELKYRLGSFTLDFFDDLSPLRQAILVCMAYQMGVQGLKGFRNTLKLLGAGYYGLAASEMLDSTWYRQDSPNRALRYSRMMKHEIVLSYYK